MPFARMELVRTVAAPVATVRAALTKALREQHFDLTAERLTSLEAKRGSQLAGGALQPKKLPVGIKIELAGDTETTTASVSLFDRWRAPGGKAWGQNRSYAELFTAVAESVDTALRSVDPDVLLTPPTFNSTAATIGLLERSNVAGGNAGQKAVQRVDQWLGGTSPAKPAGPQVVIAAPDAEAILDAERVQGMLTVALMISRVTGSMPPALAADVERVVGEIEHILDSASAGMVPVITIAETDKPVVTFLNEQARIRETLPLRSLQTCTTCRHQKVVNPDYQRLVERNRKIRGLSGFLGASISSSGVSPFILVGRMLPLVKMDPDYVCPRCQGLDADERLVVFCPNCGERRDEAALRKCGRCEHDFRQALEPETLWQPVGTAAELFAPPPPPAPLPVAPPEPVPALTAAPPPTFPPGFYADPDGRCEARWWDGSQWTAQVIINGQPGVDTGPPAQTVHGAP
jgi:hypothetical protein